MQALARGKASAGFVAIYAFAYASLWLALLTPPMVTLAVRVRQLAPENSAGPISYVLLGGAIVALVANPLFGALSDRTTSRLGRRRPWLIGGAVFGLAALAVIGRAQTTGMIMLGWCMAQLAYNAVLAAMVAIVPDHIPAAQRGTVVGVLGVCMPIGQIAGTFIVQELSYDLFLALVVPGAIGLVGVLALVFALPDAPAARSENFPDSVAAPPSAARRRFLSSHREFSWAWLSRLSFVIGCAFLSTYQPSFLLDGLHIDANDVPRLMFRATLVQAAMMVVSSLFAGRLSDRIRRRKPLVIAGSIIQGAGLWFVAAAGSYPAFLFAAALAGVGHGTFDGVDLALVTEVLPDRHRNAAEDLGLLNIANTLPQVIAPLLGPVILGSNPGDYRLLFVVAGFAAMLGSAFLLPLKNVR